MIVRFLDPAELAADQPGHSYARLEDIRNFLWYFQRSSIVQHNALANFYSTLIKEKQCIENETLYIFDIHTMRRNLSWIEDSIALLNHKVYITLDLDVFDPSVVPSVGTPEPGGMLWVEMLYFLRRIFKEKNVIGMDMVECAPRPGTEHGVYASAKCLYRCIGYWSFEK